MTEVVQGLGSWALTLDGSPREITDTLLYFGHVAIVPGRVAPAQYGDQLLTMARYVGVLTKRDSDDDRMAIAGQGMEVWLGDGDDKGEIFESPLNITGQSFANSIRAILGSGTAVVEGTLHSVPGAYTGRHQWESRRSAIRYVCSTFGAEYRVNGNGTLDAGTQAQLYAATPTCVIVRRGAEGRDLALTALPGEMQLSRDVEDFTTRVVLLAEGEGAATATGAANIASNPYLDLRGQAVKRTRLVSESGTVTGNAQSRAQLQLNRFTGTRNALRLGAEDFEVRGSFRPGDMVYVYDPDAGLYDPANEVTFRGQRINPIALRSVEASWPIVEGMTVAYRHQSGAWLDLTDFVRWETGSTTVGVGELGRSLTSTGFEPVGPRPIPDSTIPDVVSWVLPFQSSVYVDAEGNTRASMLLAWDLPLNADGSTILDGHHYEIAYGVSPAAEWQTAYAPWGELQAVVNDLSPGVVYDFRIRAVDTSANVGAWSVTESALAEADTIPPSTPAPPVVAASLIAIQITHTLGKASGGEWNLELDLDHLEVHVGASSGFAPDATTLRGKVPANAGMIQAEIAAVGTVPEPDTTLRHVKVIAVDRSGNRSPASNAAPVTALLIDNAHISDLSVSKVTAGTISANWLIGASIRTASSGQRVELNATGLHGYNSAGTELVTLSNTGSFTLRSASSGARVELDASGVRAYTSSVQTVNISSAGTFFIRSGVSPSARAEMDAAGLRMYNSSNQELVNISSGGTFAIQTGTSGARVVLSGAGVETFNGSGGRTFFANASSGDVEMTGRLTSTVSGSAARLVINPNFGVDPEIRMYEDATNYHYITSFVAGTGLQIGTTTIFNRKAVINMSDTGWQVSLLDGAGVNRTGGYVAAGTDLAELGVQGGAALRFQATHQIRLYGDWGHNNSESAIVSFTIDPGGPANSWGISYGVTLQTLPGVSFTADTGSAFDGTWIQGRTNSGVTLRTQGVGFIIAQIWAWQN
ncbi:phage tail protein [Spongiactinospora rosea]|uniref:fibronectin type III domain-containing protein n=1 Tax=Spongiactinospora rosea TaxID=2248750 RepID=UPI001314297A|nr:fibronectin type III domain-containing protein [Spongiactinospora rosea]